MDDEHSRFAAEIAEIAALVEDDGRPHDPGRGTDRVGVHNEPIVRVTNTIIIALITRGAASAEIVTGSRPGARLTNGESYDSIALPHHVYSKVAALLKQMSKLNMRRRDRRQQGSIGVIYDREDWRLSVTVAPFEDGERITVTAKRDVTAASDRQVTA